MFHGFPGKTDACFAVPPFNHLLLKTMKTFFKKLSPCLFNYWFLVKIIYHLWVYINSRYITVIRTVKMMVKQGQRIYWGKRGEERGSFLTQMCIIQESLELDTQNLYCIWFSGPCLKKEIHWLQEVWAAKEISTERKLRENIFKD